MNINEGWQLCPKCNGSGYVLITNLGSTSGNTSTQCDVCHGRNIISIATGLPPIAIPNRIG